MGRDMKPCIGFHEVPITEYNRAHCFKSCAPRVVEHLVANGMRDNRLKDGGGAHLSGSRPPLSRWQYNTWNRTWSISPSTCISGRWHKTLLATLVLAKLEKVSRLRKREEARGLGAR